MKIKVRCDITFSTENIGKPPILPEAAKKMIRADMRKILEGIMENQNNPVWTYDSELGGVLAWTINVNIDKIEKV